MNAFEKTFSLLGDDTITCVNKLGARWVVVRFKDPKSGDGKRALCFGVNSQFRFIEHCKTKRIQWTHGEPVDALPEHIANKIINTMMDCVENDPAPVRDLWMPLLLNRENHAQLRAVCEHFIEYQRTGRPQKRRKMAQVVINKHGDF